MKHILFNVKNVLEEGFIGFPELCTLFQNTCTIWYFTFSPLLGSE